MSSEQNSVLFFKISLVLTFFSLFTMVLGPLVRAEDAGLACPDWPMCKGQWLPVMDYQVLLEWLHRFSALVLGIIFLVWSGIGLCLRDIRKNHGLAIILAIALLILQIILGALTITKTLDAHVVSSHLLNAMLFWSVLIYCVYKSYFICLASKGATPPVVSKKKRDSLGLFRKEKLPGVEIRWATGIFLILIFVQLFLGVRVSANEAGRVCNTFPACYDEAVFTIHDGLQFKPLYFPPMRGNIEKHMTHRFMAYLLFVWASLLFGFSFRQKLEKQVSIFLGALLMLLLVQMLVGILNVIWSLPTALTVLHSCLAYAIYFIALLNFLETNINFDLG